MVIVARLEEREEFYQLKKGGGQRVENSQQ